MKPAAERSSVRARRRAAPVLYSVSQLEAVRDDQPVVELAAAAPTRATACPGRRAPRSRTGRGRCSRSRARTMNGTVTPSVVVVAAICSPAAGSPGRTAGTSRRVVRVVPGTAAPCRSALRQVEELVVRRLVALRVPGRRPGRSTAGSAGRRRPGRRSDGWSRRGAPRRRARMRAVSARPRRPAGRVTRPSRLARPGARERAGHVPVARA